jgi:soluble lytic murein transglycosylase-like protein
VDGEQRQQARPGYFWGAIGGVVLGFALPVAVQAADVFVSVAADGSQRYATQALDASYRIAYREAPSLPAPTAPRAKGSPAHEQLHAIIDRVALRYGVSPALVEAVVQVESGRNSDAVSPKGARGVMQLMPATAARYGLEGPVSWRDPERNIDAGVRHLKDLLAQHQGNVALALAAYNAGSGAVGRHRDRIPPYRETMLYVPAVLARSVSISAP